MRSLLRGVARRGGLGRNIASLVGGTVAGHALLLLATPLLTRLYSPAEMGEYGLFLSFVGVAVVATSLRYEAAILNPRSSSDAAVLAVSAVLIAAPMSLVLTLLMAGLRAGDVLGMGLLGQGAMLCIAPCLFLSAVFLVLRYWLLRNDEFGAAARITVWQSGTRAASQVIAGIVGLGGLGLIIGEVTGRAAGVGAMAKTHLSKILTDYRAVSVRDRIGVLRRYRAFPKYNLPSSLLDNLAGALPLPMLVVMFGPSAAGLFALAQRVLQIPIALVGRSVADAFHARLAQYARTSPGAAIRLFDRTVLVLMVTGLVPTATILLFGEQLFQFVFGAEWREAGTLAAAVAPWAYAQFIVSPTSRLVLVFEGQRLKLVSDAISLLAVVSTLVVASNAGASLTAAVAWLSAGQVISYGVYFFLLRHLLPAEPTCAE